MSYTIESLLENCKEKNYLQLLDYLSQNLQYSDKALSNIKRMGNVSADQIRKYKSYSEALLFFLNTGKKPASFDLYDFKIFKPIVSRLVDEGSQSASALEIFQLADNIRQN